MAFARDPPHDYQKEAFAGQTRQKTAHPEGRPGDRRALGPAGRSRRGTAGTTRTGDDLAARRPRARGAGASQGLSRHEPRLTGGDPDADWERADHVGEEAVGGTVATPDQSVVDELGGALGVPRAPDEELRTSGEILEQRDRYRWEQESGGDA